MKPAQVSQTTGIGAGGLIVNLHIDRNRIHQMGMAGVGVLGFWNLRETLEVAGRVLPLKPSRSLLPWSIANLRFCPWCRQLAQRDLNDCPTCGRRMPPLPE